MAAKKGPIVNVLGVKVPEAELRGTLKDILEKRGLSGTLYIENTKRRPPSKPYYNIYKYAFFG